MPNHPTNTPFEALQRSAFGVIQNQMGFVASWVPASGGDEQTARVLFQNPTEDMKLAGVDYDPSHWRAEYQIEDFVGLFEAANARQSAEVVTIEGVDYYVRKVSKKFDGKTYIAELLPAETTVVANEQEQAISTENGQALDL